MSKVKKVLNILVDVVIVFVFLLSFCLVVSSINKKKTGIAHIFGFTSNIVVTDSMEDTINVDDVIISKLLKDEELHVNDIISFYQMVNNKRILIAHRLVEIKEINGVKYYVTRGDNHVSCPENDPVNKIRGDIQSVYCFRIRGLGKLITFLKSTGGFIGCVITPILLFIAFLIYRLIKMYMQCKKEEMINDQKDTTSDDVKDAIIKEYLEKQALEAKLKEENNNLEKEE